MPGSSTTRSRSTPASASTSRRTCQLVEHLGDDVVVDRAAVHVVAVAAPVHDDVRRPGVGHDPRHARVGQAAAHVVDHVRAGRQGGGSHRGPHRVDADDHALGGQRPHDGQHPAQLLLGVDPLRARPGRLAADVDEVGAVGDEGQPVARPRRRGRR